jgi:hypothetical protein
MASHLGEIEALFRSAALRLDGTDTSAAPLAGPDP